MKTILEQFIFIPKMLDTTSTKVQQCGIWSVISSAFIWLFDSATHFTVNMVGISILYAVLLFIVMIADFWTGITASKKRVAKSSPQNYSIWIDKNSATIEKDGYTFDVEDCGYSKAALIKIYAENPTHPIFDEYKRTGAFYGFNTSNFSLDE